MVWQEYKANESVAHPAQAVVIVEVDLRHVEHGRQTLGAAHVHARTQPRTHARTHAVQARQTPHDGPSLDDVAVAATAADYRAVAR